MSKDQQSPGAAMADSSPAAGSAPYDPLKCLSEEVNRFRATNQFTPMLVTNFYAQAACVVRELSDARKELAQLRRASESQRRTISELEKRVFAYEEQWIDEHV